MRDIKQHLIVATKHKAAKQRWNKGSKHVCCDEASNAIQLSKN